MMVGRTRVEIITKTAELITAAKYMGYEITRLTKTKPQNNLW